MKSKQNRKGEARKTHHKALLIRWSMAPSLQMRRPNSGTAALKWGFLLPGGDSVNPIPGADHHTGSGGAPQVRPPLCLAFLNGPTRPKKGLQVIGGLLRVRGNIGGTWSPNPISLGCTALCCPGQFVILSFLLMRVTFMLN